MNQETGTTRTQSSAGGFADTLRFKIGVSILYRLLLRRGLDETGIAFYCGGLRDGRFRWRDVVVGISRSTERTNLKQRRKAVRHSTFRFAILYPAFRLGSTSHEALVRSLYRAILRREPDADPIARWPGYPASWLRKFRLVRNELHSSTEFARVHGFHADGLQVIHEARVHLVDKYFPPADVIVDIGGAARNHPEGALLAIGYGRNRKPHEVIVVDLPPDDRVSQDRFHGNWGAETDAVHRTDDGVTVRYVYSPMWDLSAIADGTADLVVSGESIEHVTRAEADAALREAMRVLKPGGSLCLDTPNAALTRLESPDGFIHPEHKHEYTVEEMTELLDRIGFQVSERVGLRAMPDSRANGFFDREELVTGAEFSDEPDDGYLFFVRATKPTTARF